MKNLYIIVLLGLLLPLKAIATTPLQESTEAQLSIVKWLTFYDYIAFASSDSVNRAPKETRMLLGKEWFCIPDDSLWHAYYGKLDSTVYNAILHYTVNQEGYVRRSNAVTDTILLTRYANALKTAYSHYKTQTDSLGIRLNQYIQQNPDSTFTVYILPAFQPNGLTLYGLEYIYHINAIGTEIISRDNQHEQALRGFFANPEQEIWLDYTAHTNPTLGALFFTWYYRTYFKGINLELKNAIIAPVNSQHGWQLKAVDKPKRRKKSATLQDNTLFVIQ